MLKRIVFLFLLSLTVCIVTLMPALGFAEMSDEERCKPVRMDQEGGPFEKIPAYNQSKFSEEEDSVRFMEKNISASGQNLCYAIVSSELIDADRFGKGDKLETLTSPLSIALNHKTLMKSISPESFSGTGSGTDDPTVIGPGNPMMAIISNKGQRVCDQRWLEKYAAMMESSGPQEIPDSPTGRSVRTFFKGVFDQVQKVSKLSGSLVLKQKILNEYFACRTDLQGQNLNSIISASHAALLSTGEIPKAQIFLLNLCKENSLLVNPPKPVFYDGVEVNADLQNKMNALYSKRFGEGIPRDVQENANIEFKKLRAQQTVEDGKYASRLKSKISSLLQAPNNKPVGIGFCDDALEGGSCMSANHTAVIIGQRWNGKSCEFLLRDSKPRSCKSWSKYKCDNGSIWVSESLLINKSGGPVNESGTGIYWLP